MKAVILVRSPRAITAPRLRKIEGVKEAFDVMGRFDAVALIEVPSYRDVKRVAMRVQEVESVRRTETLMQVE